MKATLALTISLIILMAAGLVTFKYYDLLFAETVEGEVIDVQRVTEPGIIVNSQTLAGGKGGDIPDKVFSFAVAMKELNGGKIHTSSSEDRQWGVVQKGFCAKARFFPFPPWNLEKRGTNRSVRLIQIFECPKP
ncbi:MAG: hypothetical protein JNL01_01100 [Bdellovibrionales bacterium]|nr:hypothetical protein [Bdellovibrionales bacterium]